jgi:hypothetical protein
VEEHRTGFPTPSDVTDAEACHREQLGPKRGHGFDETQSEVSSGTVTFSGVEGPRGALPFDGFVARQIDLAD